MTDWALVKCPKCGWVHFACPPDVEVQQRCFRLHCGATSDTFVLADHADALEGVTVQGIHVPEWRSRELGVEPPKR